MQDIRGPRTMHSFGDRLSLAVFRFSRGCLSHTTIHTTATDAEDIPPESNKSNKSNESDGEDDDDDSDDDYDDNDNENDHFEEGRRIRDLIANYMAHN